MSLEGGEPHVALAAAEEAEVCPQAGPLAILPGPLQERFLQGVLALPLYEERTGPGVGG